MATVSPQNVRVAVLRGGPSDEYDLSLSSGGAVLQALEDEGNARDIFIDTKGVWHERGIARRAGDILPRYDMVFNALHGEYGEGGEGIQLLAQHSIPFSGSHALPSALAFNKVRSRELFERNDIRVPYGKVFSLRDGTIDELAFSIFRSMPLPLIIKPVSSGSSHGVTLVKDYHSLVLGLENGFRRSHDLLLEEYIDGFLISVGVVEHLRDEELYTLIPTEIRYNRDHGYFDYRDVSHKTYLTPRHLPHSQIKEIERQAKSAHEGLGLRHYSRSEFIVSPSRGVYMIEINSHPDLSEDSPFVHALQNIGMNVKHFLHHVTERVLSR